MALLLLLGTNEAQGTIYEIKIVKEKERQGAPSQLIIYKVKKGDTLYGILRKFHIPPIYLNKVVKINKLKNPNLIYVGQRLKLPVGKDSQGKTKSSPERYLIPSVKVVGGKVENEGVFFLGEKKIDYRETPKVEIGGKKFIVDLSKSLDEETRKALGDLGIEIIDGKKLKELIEEQIAGNFLDIKKNGKIILGLNDILTYHYDYMGYNKLSGQLTIINLKPDTPCGLLGLLRSYGIEVLQPKAPHLDIKKEGKGELKILPGEGLDKLNSLVEILLGEKGKVNELGLELPKSKIYVVYDYVDPEERVKLELSGYKVAVLSGNFLADVEKLLEIVPLANKRINLILYEPPLSKDKNFRSKLEIKGLLVSTGKKEWFLVDALDKPEEIPYLLERGINLIIY
ncbi:LysM peptidoglycan-binding domain-containing protein [Phorcysia thermohydrogeniphila]|uniref:LysM peptidoglycan-binding domain-containing protein n=1 Tax=Phorcysia thermohydrogeniphila TaxID=936138 RepID=UPI00140227FA|nr:LysM domain-containing protein [Phorcysia thermohydrogeniphila]